MKKQLGELLAIMMVGDGVLAMTIPDRYLRVWERGPVSMRKAVRKLRRHEKTTRVLGGLEAVLGIWIAARIAR